MKTSVSSLNVTICSRVWGTSSQREKPLLCLNQSRTLTAIRNGKMTATEVSTVRDLTTACFFYYYYFFFLFFFFEEPCFEAFHLRGKMNFDISSWIIFGGALLFPSSGEGQEPAFSFLATLASSSSEEIESQLQERVESSRRAVSQIVTVYDKLQEKVELLSRKLNSGGEARTRRWGAEGGGIRTHLCVLICSYIFIFY